MPVFCAAEQRTYALIPHRIGDDHRRNGTFHDRLRSLDDADRYADRLEDDEVEEALAHSRPQLHPWIYHNHRRARFAGARKERARDRYGGAHRNGFRGCRTLFACEYASYTLCDPAQMAPYGALRDRFRSCGNLRAVTDSLLRKATDFDKLQGAAKRLALSLELDSGEMTEIPSAITAVSMNGKVRFDTIERNSDKIWRIGDFYGVGQWFLDAFIGCLHNFDVKARIAHDCIEPRYSEGVLLESHKLGFVIGKEEDGDKFINPKRFVRTDKIREIRGELRYTSRLYSNCLNGALHALNEAKLYHFLLEDIYKHSMNFDALNEFSLELSKGVWEA